jgi:hypothetical protein
MATILTEMGHLTDSLLTNAGRKMATHSKSKTCRNTIDHKPISIKVEFDKLIAAPRNSGVIGATLYVLSAQ